MIRVYSKVEQNKQLYYSEQGGGGEESASFFLWLTTQRAALFAESKIFFSTISSTFLWRKKVRAKVASDHA